MNKQTFEDPLKFFCLIANEIQHEKISPTLYKAFVDNKLALEKEFKKPELKKAIEEGKLIPFKPETFEQFVAHYLKRKSKELRVELQSYTSAFESEEKIKTYIIQQYTFLANYYIENRDSYNKEYLKGSKGNIEKAGILITLKYILNNIERDYKVYLFNVTNSNSVNKQDASTIVYALFHYYKQSGKYEPEFIRNSKENKREVIKKQAKKYGVGEDAFVNCYYSIQHGKQSERISIKNIPHIKKAIEMLKEYPKAREIAKIEFRQAELLK